ncbi:MAG: hypothetical protein HN356_04020 [Calditrichaeota bacterium]|nr:hypothetical protein [Calditrichota bacterium]MBT7789831.1 hypothetical protein [Calditrichota bacterium]
MIYRRSLKIIVVLVVFCLFLPQVGTAASSQFDRLTEDQLYQAYTDYFFLKREVSFSAEMTVRESFLKWMFDGINVEVSKRQRKDPKSVNQAFSPPELAGFDESSYRMPDNMEGAPRRYQYRAWEQYRRDEFNHKFLQARLIKDRLIESSDPNQLKRMFRFDLETALDSYKSGIYSEAIMRLSEVIDSYGYEYLEDVKFYRAESYFALKMFSRTIPAYEHNVNSDDNDDHRRISLERLISIAGDRGNASRVLEYWTTYQDLFGYRSDKQFWHVTDLAARYLMFIGDAENAITLFDLIPPSNDVSNNLFEQSQLHAAECYLALEDFDNAENRFTALLEEELERALISPEVNDQAKLKLGYIAFMKEDFGKAFTNFVELRELDYLREEADISIVWALFRLGDFENALMVGQYFFNTYTSSHYLSEASAIIGACAETLGNDSLASIKYEDLMDAARAYREYQAINLEKETVRDIQKEIIPLEIDVFINNQKSLFPQYLQLRRKIDRLEEKIALFESSRSRPIIKELVLERTKLRDLLKGHEDSKDLIAELSNSESRSERKLAENYAYQISEIEDMLYLVDNGIQRELNRKSLIQHEADEEYQSSQQELLNRQYESESLALENAITNVEELSAQSRQVHDPKLQIDMTGIDLELSNLVDELAVLNFSINTSNKIDIASNLDSWSRFAVKRSIYGGLDFEDYHAREQQLQDLDQYIQQLNAVLSSKRRIAEMEKEQSTVFVSEVSTDSDRYFAPEIPMWEPKVVPEESVEEPEPLSDEVPVEPDAEILGEPGTGTPTESDTETPVEQDNEVPSESNIELPVESETETPSSTDTEPQTDSESNQNQESNQP